MKWIIVTDENGVDFNALTDFQSGDDNVTAWVFTDKESGFHDDVGRVNMKTGLKRLPDGKFGP